ncbi:hypothetical protein [Alicyclobacillus hesperidum]|nr:hypothetical protein [Alicyclobacillus hesperidum]
MEDRQAMWRGIQQDYLKWMAVAAFCVAFAPVVYTYWRARA